MTETHGVLIIIPEQQFTAWVLAEGLKRIKERKKTHRGWAAKFAGHPVRNVATFGFLINLDFLIQESFPELNIR